MINYIILKLQTIGKLYLFITFQESVLKLYHILCKMFHTVYDYTVIFFYIINVL